ncbi:MAG TPA: DNA-directed RNA polymerase subunit omega [Acidobacteriaceae bacterium]|jgi:DNA-directed RNA polymerase subunit omega|nr:DNA-directed RNA polymerase subunit omega [Acidobacteriaceae bacterium]
METIPPTESKYRTVHVAARRARQLQSGANPLITPRSTKACRVAQDELRAGKVDYVVPEPPTQKELELPVGYTPILHS